MAKKKKLNKRVVVLLSLLGVAVLLSAGAAVVLALPKDVNALMAKGDAEFAAKNYASADKLYEDAIREATSKNKLTPEMLSKSAELQLEWIKSPVLTQSERAGRYQKAKSNYGRALRIDRSNISCQKAMTDLIWGEAVGAGHWADFIKEANNLLALDAQDHKTYYRRALANAELANTMRGSYWKQSQDDFLKAIELKGDDAEYWTMYCQALSKFDPEKAEPTFKQALEAIKDKAVIHVAYADYLAGKGGDRLKDARAQYAEAISIEPKNVLGYLSFARFEQASRDLEAAKQKLDEAKKADPADHRPYRELARIATIQGKPDEGIAILRSGIEAVVPRTTTTSAPANDEMEQRRVEAARADLYNLLVNALLDRCDGSTPEDRTKLIEESKSYRDRLAPLGKSAIDRVDGRIAFSEGRIDDARKLLEASYESSQGFDMQTAQTAMLLIQAYMVEKMSGKAMPIAERFLKTPGFEQNPIGNIFKAQIYMQARNYEDAKKEVDAALLKQRDHATALQMKADLESLTRGELSKELKLSPERVPLYLERATAMWSDDRQDEALNLLESLYDRMPDDLRIVQQIAIFYMSAGKNEKAKEVLSKAQEKYKDNPTIVKALNILNEPNADKRMEMMLVDKSTIEDPVVRSIEKARVYAMFGKAAETESALGEAARLSPQDLRVIEMQFRMAVGGKEKNFNLADDCARRASAVSLTIGKQFNARIAIVRGDFAAAAGMLNDLLRESPGHKQMRVMLAECYLAMNDAKKAEEAYRQVADLDPSYADAIIGMAKVTELLAMWSEHSMYVERAYQLAPQHPYIQQERLKLQVERQKPAEAIKLLEEWRSKNPEDVGNLMRLANLYERTHELDNAERILRLLYSRGNNKLQAAGWLMGFYLRTNRMSEVEAILNQIYTVTDDKVGAFVLAGDVRLAQGSPESIDLAKRAYQEAIDASPNNEARGYEAMARYFAFRGQLAEAVEMQRKVLERRPDAAAEKLLARMLLGAGQSDEAKAILTRVLEKSSSDPEALDMMATVLISKRQTKEAIQQLDAAVQANPASLDPLLRRAALQIVLGDSDKAKEDLKKVQQIATTPEGFRLAAGMYMRLRDEESAERLYNEALTKQEDYRPAVMDLAMLYLSQRKWDRLDPLLEKAGKLFPQNLQVFTLKAESFKRRLDQPRRALAMEEALKVSQDKAVVSEYIQALLDANQSDKAVDVCDKQGQRGGAWLSALKARGLMQSRKSAEAEALFSKALTEATSEDVSAILEQVDKAYGSKDGLSKIEGWLSLRPKDWVMVSRLADMYVKRKNDESLKKASGLLVKALELAEKPEQKAEVEASMGIVCHQLGDTVGAEKHYLAALKVSPDNPGWLNNLAYLYADEMNDPSKALPHAEKVVTVVPNNPDILDTYGWTLAKMNDLDKAESVLLRALQGDRPSPMSRYHLGWVYERQQSADKARTQYQLGLNMLTDEDKSDKVYKLLQEGLDRVKRSGK